MANEIDIVQYLNTQGFTTVKLYDEATTDLATTVYPTGGFAPMTTTVATEGFTENTIMIRYKGTSPAEINTRMEAIKTALLTANITGIAGVKLLSDRLALGKDATGHFFFSQNYIIMRDTI